MSLSNQISISSLMPKSKIHLLIHPVMCCGIRPPNKDAQKSGLRRGLENLLARLKVGVVGVVKTTHRGVPKLLVRTTVHKTMNRELHKLLVWTRVRKTINQKLQKLLS